MAVFDLIARLWALGRKIEDLFVLQTKTTAALADLGSRLHSLEDRMTRLEAGQQQLVVEARSAAAAAATMVSSAVISDVITRLTRIEMRAEAAQPHSPPPPAG